MLAAVKEKQRQTDDSYGTRATMWLASEKYAAPQLQQQQQHNNNSTNVIFRLLIRQPAEAVSMMRVKKAKTKIEKKKIRKL